VENVLYKYSQQHFGLLTLTLRLVRCRMRKPIIRLGTQTITDDQSQPTAYLNNIQNVIISHIFVTYRVIPYIDFLKNSEILKL